MNIQVSRHIHKHNQLLMCASSSIAGSLVTLAFFQLEMHGGIFHSCCSFTVTLRLGECITGAGGDGGPLGIFLFVLQLAVNTSVIMFSTQQYKLAAAALNRLQTLFNFSVNLHSNYRQLHHVTCTSYTMSCTLHSLKPHFIYNVLHTPSMKAVHISYTKMLSY